MRHRFDLVLQALKEEPLVLVGAPPSRMPFAVTYNDIKELLFVSLYLPMLLFPVLAFLVDLIYRGGDLTLIAYPLDLGFFCSLNFEMITYPGDANVGCRCGDERWPVRFHR